MSSKKKPAVEELIGNICLINYDKSSLNEEVLHLVGNHHIGGVFLTYSHFQKPKQVHKISDYLQRYASFQSPIFIGAYNNMLPLTEKGMTETIDQEEIEKQDNRLQTKQLAEMHGEELKAVGINSITIPFPDFEANDSNFDPQLKSKIQHMVATIEGYQKNSVQVMLTIDNLLNKIDENERATSGRNMQHVKKLFDHVPIVIIQNKDKITHYAKLLREGIEYNGVIISDVNDPDISAKEIIAMLHEGIDAFILHKNYKAQITLIAALLEEAKEVKSISLEQLRLANSRIKYAQNTEGLGALVKYNRHTLQNPELHELVDELSK